MQIFVLGSHRSGTSLLTRLINMTGAFFGVGGASIGFNTDNPKGFWERRDVVECNDAILEHFGCSWDSLAGWSMQAKPAKKDLKKLKEIDDTIKSIVLELDANRPWVVKDPRLCLTMPFWKDHLEVPVAVTMARDPLEVALSLKSRNQFSLHHGLAIWEYYTVGILNATRDMQVIRTTHQDILSDPVASVKKLLEELEKAKVQSLRMPAEEEITSFIEPKLYQSKADGMDVNGLLTPFQSKLQDYITGKKKAPTTLLQPSEGAKEAFEFYATAKRDKEKLIESNRNFAAADQQRNELNAELQLAQARLKEREKEYSGKVAHLESQIGDLKRSTSWRLGYFIIRMFKTLTFQKV